MSRVATVLTHRRAVDTAKALEELIGAAARADVTLRFDPEETEKHGLAPRHGLEIDAELSRDVDLCVVMGGDGTILTALREYVNTGVPVPSGGPADASSRCGGAPSDASSGGRWPALA